LAKRRSSGTRSRSSARRPTARKRSAPPRDNRIRLKPVLQQIEVSLAQLQKLPPSDRITYAIGQLEKAQMLFADICTPLGCGPDMAFPLKPLKV
jgi:hypothetical protein